LVLLAVAVATMRHFVWPHLESLKDSPDRERAGAAARVCFDTAYAFLLVALATYGAVGGWMLIIQAASSSPTDAYWVLVLPLVVVAAVLLTLLIGGVVRARRRQAAYQTIDGELRHLQELRVRYALAAAEEGAYVSWFAPMDRRIGDLLEKREVALQRAMAVARDGLTARVWQMLVGGRALVGVSDGRGRRERAQAGVSPRRSRFTA
jgi:hypothetical protein